MYTLKDNDGNISNISPVKTLKRYLDINRDRKSNRFLHTKYGKELTVPGLNSVICSIIRDAEPMQKKGLMTSENGNMAIIPEI